MPGFLSELMFTNNYDVITWWGRGLPCLGFTAVSMTTPNWNTILRPKCWSYLWPPHTHMRAHIHTCAHAHTHARTHTNLKVTYPDIDSLPRPRPLLCLGGIFVWYALLFMMVRGKGGHWEGQGAQVAGTRLVRSLGGRPQWAARVNRKSSVCVEKMWVRRRRESEVRSHQCVGQLLTINMNSTTTLLVPHCPANITLKLERELSFSVTAFSWVTQNTGSAKHCTMNSGYEY